MKLDVHVTHLHRVPRVGLDHTEPLGLPETNWDYKVNFVTADDGRNAVSLTEAKQSLSGRVIF